MSVLDASIPLAFKVSNILNALPTRPGTVIKNTFLESLRKSAVVETLRLLRLRHGCRNVAHVHRRNSAAFANRTWEVNDCPLNGFRSAGGVSIWLRK